MKDPLRDLSEELRKKLKEEITAIPLKECRFVFPVYHLWGIDTIQLIRSTAFWVPAAAVSLNARVLAVFTTIFAVLLRRAPASRMRTLASDFLVCHFSRSPSTS